MHTHEYRIPSDLLNIPAIDIDELEAMLAGESMATAKGGRRRAAGRRRGRANERDEGRRGDGRGSRR